jgi:predicted RNA-binding protein Jag
MDLKEFSGENVEAATAKAEAYFGLSRDDLKIKVVADEASGLYRVGLEKRAVIVARPTPAAAPRARVQAPPPAAGPAERGGGRAAREARPRRERTGPAEDTGAEALYKPRRSEGEGPAEPRGPRTEASDRAREILEGVLSRMPIEGEIEVLGGESPEAVELIVRGDAQGLLTGDEGGALAALTYLVNRMVNKGRRNTKRVVIEAGGFRSDHVASLEGLARDLALRGVPGIATQSDGEGPYKRVVITPAEKS